MGTAEQRHAEAVQQLALREWRRWLARSCDPAQEVGRQNVQCVQALAMTDPSKAACLPAYRSAAHDTRARART